MAFSLRFATSRGAAFQDFFSDLMEAANVGFERVRAGGPTGDLKCDGFIRDTGTLFQVYGPRDAENKISQAVSKLKADFAGAKTKWGVLLKQWVFVHNDTEGQRAEVVKALATLAAANKKIVFATWSKPELLAIVRKLDTTARANLFGREPEARDFVHPPFALVSPMLKHIETRPKADFDTGPIREVPANKLAYNDLSHDVTVFLQAGRRGDAVIEKYIAQHRDPTYGQRLASAFAAQYRTLREVGHEPDDIFHHLTCFVGGGYQQSPRHQGAIYCILAYFFERCDIFEAPP